MITSVFHYQFHPITTMFNFKIWFWMIVIFIIGAIEIEGANLRLYLGTNDHTTFSLTSAGDLYNSESFNKTADTVIYTHGFNGSPDGEVSVAITEGYCDNYNGNFVFLDWSEEASSAPFGFAAGYAIKAVPNTKKVGKQLGEAILDLIKAGFNIAQLHLMGHSLGAHLMGYAGKRVKQNNTTVPRITGLDPAGPLYSNVLIPINGLTPSSGGFVDVVHSCPGTYGTSESIGHVDIWLNCDNKEQPGCSNTTTDSLLPFGQADFCSHKRAPLVYAESLGSPESFPAIQANSCRDWLTNNDTNTTIVYISEYNVDTEARGDFYLRTNSEKPYGLGEEGLSP